MFEQVFEGLLNDLVVEFGSGGEDVQVGSIGIIGSGIAGKPVIKRLVRRRREEGVTVLVLSEGSRLALKRHNKMSPIDAMVVAVGAGHGAQQLTAIEQLDAFKADVTCEFLANIGGRNRVVMVLYSDQASGPDTAQLPSKIGHAAGWDFMQMGLFLGPCLTARGVAGVEQLVEKVVVLLNRVKIATGPE